MFGLESVRNGEIFRSVFSKDLKKTSPNVLFHCSSSALTGKKSLSELIISSHYLSSLFKALCPWCHCLSSPMSATPPCCTPPRSTSQTSGRPGSLSGAPGSTLSSGPCRPSWVGAATGPRDPAPRAPSSGTSVQPPASPMCCVSSSSVCCCPSCSCSTRTDVSWSQSGG